MRYFTLIDRFNKDSHYLFSMANYRCSSWGTKTRAKAKLNDQVKHLRNSKFIGILYNLCFLPIWKTPKPFTGKIIVSCHATLIRVGSRLMLLPHERKSSIINWDTTHPSSVNLGWVFGSSFLPATFLCISFLVDICFPLLLELCPVS